METASATTMTQQEGLNQVVINKVQRMIDGKAVGVQATMERLVNEGKIAQDYIAPSRSEPETERPRPRYHFRRTGKPPVDEYARRRVLSPR